MQHVKIQSHAVDQKTSFFGSIWPTESYATFEILNFSQKGHIIYSDHYEKIDAET